MTLRWRALLGDRPTTHALRAGGLPSALLSLDFADVAVPNKAFKRVVRDLEFDVAELALMTFLMARSRDVPLRLLPVVVFSRNPLPLLVCRAEPGPLRPADLAGRRVGVRAYTTTTAVWARALLRDLYGVDSHTITWITCEEGHVAGVAEPANVRRDPAHEDLAALLLDGAIDAALVDPIPRDPRIVAVLPDAEDAYRRWREATGACAINHMVVVRASLAHDRAAMAELLRLFGESRDRGGEKVDRASTPIGLDANRRNLDVAIAVASAQGLLARPLTVEDLVTRETI